MASMINVLPIYEPKIDEITMTKIDLNIRDLQDKYSHWCICCGTIFYPKKFSSMISSHFNTIKHKKKCINPNNQEFKQNFGCSNNLYEAFENKCKENRNLKKLNYEYKDEIDKSKFKIERLEQLNMKLQDLIQCGNNSNIKCENLIDLE